MRWIVTTASKIFGSDSEDRAGVGPFSLPESHPFTRCARVHDFYFTYAESYKQRGMPLTEQTLTETDLQLFRCWVAIIYAQTDLQLQFELVMDLCAYFPAAVKVGPFLWDGPKDETN